MVEGLGCRLRIFLELLATPSCAHAMIPEPCSPSTSDAYMSMQRAYVFLDCEPFWTICELKKEQPSR